MKKRWWIISIIAVILILLFLFYPLCGFKMLGSQYKDDCNTCGCTLLGPVCTLLGCLDCVKEGETGNIFDEEACCEGLDSKSKYDLDSCIALPNDEFTCINCGNEECGLGENKCNCPEDCEEETLCLGVGDYSFAVSGKCCAGLKENEICWVVTDDGKCVDSNCSYYSCIDCGDGVCDASVDSLGKPLENKCNCPEDCKVSDCAKEGELCAGIPGNECCEGLVCEGGGDVDPDPEARADIEGVCVTAFCDDYSYPQTQEQAENCLCPEGKIKGTTPQRDYSYCTTNSKTPCNSHDDCTEGESCKSRDGENWECSGFKLGCYYDDPENTESEICVS